MEPGLEQNEVAEDSTVTDAGSNRSWTFQKYWWLGLLGFVGIYKIPVLWAVVSGDTSLLDGLNVLWFLWFGYFFPEEQVDAGQ